MYFEPDQKNYYRFPSNNTINNLDLRYYFPDKKHTSEENAGFEDNAADYISSLEEHFHNF